MSEAVLSVGVSCRFNLLKAAYFQHTRNYQDAIFHYLKAAELRPSALFYYHVAVNYWWLGMLDESITHLEKAKELNTKLSNVNTLLAGIYLQQGELANAVAIYKEISVQEPGGSSYTNLAVASLLSKDYASAVELARLALEFDPNHIGRKINYADALLLYGESDKANLIYNQVVEDTLGQNDLLSLTRIAQAHLHLGETSKALKAINEAKKISPKNPNVLFISAMILAQIKETQSALLDIEGSIQNGLGKIWYYFPWFDSLCKEPKFDNLVSIESSNIVKRCIN